MKTPVAIEIDASLSVTKIKAENVVKPPQNPVPAKALRSGRVPHLAAIIPRSAQPRILMTVMEVSVEDDSSVIR